MDHDRGIIRLGIKPVYLMRRGVWPMKATIFDCDGTLVDSEILANEVLVEMVAEHGLTLS